MNVFVTSELNGADPKPGLKTPKQRHHYHLVTARFSNDFLTTNFTLVQRTALNFTELHRT